MRVRSGEPAKDPQKFPLGQQKERVFDFQYTPSKDALSSADF